MSKHELTENQLKCISELERSTAILAGAGSGKTKIITERIHNIVAKKTADFSQIVAITFTEKAAGELIYRLSKELPANLKPHISNAEITTIHGFCSGILRENAALVNVPPDFEVLEEHTARIIIHRIISHTLKEMLNNDSEDAALIVEELDFKYAVACLEEMLESRYYIDNLFKNEKNIPNQVSILADQERELINSLINVYKLISHKVDKEKIELGFLDFNDLEIKTLDILKRNPDVRDKYQNRIKHLLVDEYQDTSKIQSEIIAQIYNPQKNILCIVGDPGQSIYGFRNADPSGINDMRLIIEKNGGFSVQLTENFRSTPQVVEFINRIFKEENDNNQFLELKSTLESKRSPGAMLIKIPNKDLNAQDLRKKEAVILAHLINELESSGQSDFGEMAVLLRSFSNISIIEEALTTKKIPYYRSGGRSFLQQPEINDILLCLKTLISPDNDTLTYGLMRSPIIGLSDEECYMRLKNKKSSLFNTIASEPEFDFLTNLMEMKDQLSVSDLIYKIISFSALPNIYEHIQGSGQPTSNIEKLIFLSKTLARQHYFNLNDFIEYIEDLKIRGLGIGEPPIFGTKDNAVKLLTVHAAKGLEFKTVILPDLFRSSKNYSLPYMIDRESQEAAESIGFKLRDTDNPVSNKNKSPNFEKIQAKYKDKEKSEEERLLYVATTRAKESIYLLIPEHIQSKTKSTWLDLLKDHTNKLPIMPVNIDHEAEKDTDREYYPAYSIPQKKKYKIKHLTVSQLETYYRCPQEYYLKYILKLPSEQINLQRQSVPANTIGNIVHKLIQIMSETETLDWIKYIALIAREYGFNNISESDIKKIKHFIDVYLKSRYANRLLTNPQHEIPFTMNLEGTYIKGTIDCIYEENNRYNLIDFKTDAIKDSAILKRKIEEYRLQTLTYSIAGNLALNKDIGEMSLLFLDNGHVWQKKIGEEELTEGRNIIRTIISSIEKGNYSVTDSNTPCSSCSYHHISTCWLDKVGNQNR